MNCSRHLKAEHNSHKGSAVARWRRRRRQSSLAAARRGSVKSRVKRLQTLIPGGRGLKPDHLFLRTADYILHLRLQVNFLQALSKIYHKP